MRRATFVLIPLLASACTWVQPTAGSKNVRVATPAEVAGCEELGTASGTTMSRFFGLIPRDGDVIREEQTQLARNRAADLGGNTIVEDFPSAPPQPASNAKKPSKDTLTFRVYRCS